MKVDITSKVIEKGIDLAKDFLDKLIGPTVEETGLLIKDQIASWRFKNQIKALNKAMEYCEKHKINPKQISFKLICPLLDYASLEEDEILQDKWAVLISNLVDSSQNIDNHVFPYILSQISLNEYTALEKSYWKKQEHIKDLNRQLEEFDKNFPEKERVLLEKIEQNTNPPFGSYKFKEELRKLKAQRDKILQSLKTPESLDDNALKEFEISNLVRLGLIKNVIEHYAYAKPLKLNREDFERGVNMDLEIDISQDYEYNIITELGELFISACTEKDKL